MTLGDLKKGIEKVISVTYYIWFQVKVRTISKIFHCIVCAIILFDNSYTNIASFFIIDETTVVCHTFIGIIYICIHDESTKKEKFNKLILLLDRLCFFGYRTKLQVILEFENAVPT